MTTRWLQCLGQGPLSTLLTLGRKQVGFLKWFGRWVTLGGLFQDTHGLALIDKEVLEAEGLSQLQWRQIGSEQQAQGQSQAEEECLDLERPHSLTRVMLRTSFLLTKSMRETLPKRSILQRQWLTTWFMLRGTSEGHWTSLQKPLWCISMKTGGWKRDWGSAISNSEW